MTLVRHTPDFTEKEASDLVLKLYGFTVRAEPLPSERDQNFRIIADTGDRYVLKIANAGEAREILEAQNQAMTHLSDRTDFDPWNRSAPAPPIGSSPASWERV